MALELNGTTGVSAVQAGAVESGDLPAGSVIQVVNAEITSTKSTTSTSFQFTDLEASITPISSNSKVLININFVGVYVRGSSVNEGVALAVFKNGSNYKTLEALAGYNDSTQRNAIGGVSASFLDSPSTTSEVTYSGFFHSNEGSEVRVNSENNNITARSTITLMEIAG